jgi:hypothetical protein
MGLFLISLKRSVISLHVVRKPLVPHFLGSVADSPGEEKWVQQLKGISAHRLPTHEAAVHLGQAHL